MSMNLDEALASIRNSSRWSERDKGTAFERLVQKSLSSHPGEYGSHRFERIVPWNEWEGSNGDPDTGIDLIGYQRTGGLAAIQCKFYSPGKTLKKGDLDSFIAKSANSKFTARILVNTSDSFSPHAARLMSEVEPHVEMILLEDMRRWSVEDWGACLDGDGDLVWDHKPHAPLPHQEEAISDVLNGFKHESRGKLIMPCGTGKSVTSLWIAEQQAGLGNTVLYLVPSIALLGQAMREWAANRQLRHTYVGVCSDTRTGKTGEDQTLAELTCPVTTNAESIAAYLKPDPHSMRVVFATYQSLPKVKEAQRLAGKQAGFALAICDEAHRTTGAEQETASGFHLIHSQQNIITDKRLYMTATPKVYTDTRKRNSDGFGFYSMDDEDIYGPEFHRLTFGEAIERELLCDYQVVAIAVDSSVVGESNNKHETAELNQEQMVRLSGIIDALADPETDGLAGHERRATGTINPSTAVKRSIAFSNTIAQSKRVERWLPIVADRLFSQADPDTRRKELIDLKVQHIDGTSDALTRARHLQWLRDGDTGNTGSLMLSNARCLTEGIDVPALDAIVMCSPKKSQIDVVQAVGRVMRRSPGKKTGYVILPVPVPDGQSVIDALDTSAFNEVWAVLRALRSHDERLDITVNSADLTNARPPITVIDDTATGRSRRSDQFDDEPSTAVQQHATEQLALELYGKIASVLVERVGDRQYWKRWGNRVSDIVNTIKQDITVITKKPEVRNEWTQIAKDIAGEIGVEPNPDDLQEMVAQHAVTVPVFNHLFPGLSFAQKNPMSLTLTAALELLQNNGCDIDELCAPLAGFYKSVADRLEGADGDARVSVLLEVYESFFASAMPDTVSKLGIVYTPLEIVDFILRSVDAVARQEFGRGLTDENVHVLDPFTGTGTFINRLIAGERSDGQPLIETKDLQRKYAGDGDDTPPELHANEIVLLAYYLAAIKIQSAFIDREPADSTKQFQGLVYGDTFLRQQDRQKPQLLGTRRNSRRADRQNDQPIMAIIGNPPWSSGQDSAGDDNPNKVYTALSETVRATYGAKHKEITNQTPGGNALGNLYIKAFRWACDRLTQTNTPSHNGQGIIAFVHPNSLATATSLAGMRGTFSDEFTDIYVVNLRGDAAKSGEEWRREGDNPFAGGSRNGVQITVLVRNPAGNIDEPATLHYAEVPEYATLKQKFDWLAALGDVTGEGFEVIEPNDSHDWVNLTDGSFGQLLPVITSDRKNPVNVGVAVALHARGVATSCDAYVYSFSRSELCERIKTLLSAYDDALELVEAGCTVEECTINDDLDRIKWTDTLKQSLRRREEIDFDESRIREVLYRPFTKLWLYEDDRILSSVKTVSAMFPEPQAQVDGGGGVFISTPSTTSIFTILAANQLGDLKAAGINAACRFIPQRRRS